MEETAVATRRVNRLALIDSQMDVRTKLAPTPAEGGATDARGNQGASNSRSSCQLSILVNVVLRNISLYIVMPLSDVNDELYLGTLRKREPIGAGNFAKNEQSARYNIQKAKDPVKRQRSKGQHHGSAEKNSKVDLHLRICFFQIVRFHIHFIYIFMKVICKGLARRSIARNLSRMSIHR